MQNIYFSLGSNQGNRFFNLQQAIQYIELRIGYVDKMSSYYETEPWGFDSENTFINQVILVKSSLKAEKILARALLIEKVLGRERFSVSKGYSSRPIDIDILFVDDLKISTSDLKVPHPHLHKRNFVLKPLCEIAPHLHHPTLNKTISELTEESTDGIIFLISSRMFLTSISDKPQLFPVSTQC